MAKNGEKTLYVNEWGCPKLCSSLHYKKSKFENVVAVHHMYENVCK